MSIRDIINRPYFGVFGHKSFFDAIDTTDERAIAYLVGNSYEFNIYNDDGLTPLHYAICKENTKIFNLLLAYTKDIDLISEDNKETAFEFSIKQNKIPYAESLLREGANINHIDKNQYSALRYAVEADNNEAVAFLLRNNVDVNSISELEFSPVITALSNNNCSMLLSLIEKGAKYDFYDVNGCNPLFFAVNSGNQASIELLLNKGLDINNVNLKGDTALYTAVSNNKEEIIDILIAKGVDINKANKVNENPLKIAIETSQIHVVEKLLKIGANLDSIDSYNPIFSLIEKGDIEICALLLEYNMLDVNSLSNSNHSALYYAALENNPNFINLLLEYGAIFHPEYESGFSMLFKSNHNFEEQEEMMVCNDQEIDLAGITSKVFE